MGALNVNRNVVGVGKRQQQKNGWEKYGVLGDYIKPVNSISYIDTGLVVKGTNNKITTDVRLGFRYGSRVSATENAFCAYFTALNAYTAFFGDNYLSGLRIDLTKRNLIEHKNGEFKLNGSIVKTYTPYNYTSDLPLYLFRFNGNTTTSIGECYTFDFEQDNKILCNYKALYLTKQTIIDAGGRVHNIGDWVMFDIVTNTVPEHFGTFTGGYASDMNKTLQNNLRSLNISPSENNLIQ